MCDCISEVNTMLRERNTQLVTTMFRRPEVVAVSTVKIESKKRGGPSIMIASFCPFCGVKYPAHSAEAA